MKSRRTIRFLILPALLCLLAAVPRDGAQAQPGDWSVVLHAPPGFDLHMESLWWVEINNRESRPVEVTLFGEVTEMQRQQLFHGRSNSILIPPGGRIITAPDITSITEEWYETEFLETLKRNRVFPAGVYTLCVTVNAVEDMRPLGTGCRTHIVTMPSAPRLLAPEDEAVLDEPWPRFLWENPEPIPAGEEVVIRVTICEVMDRQNSQDAIENIAHYETEGRFRSLLYPLDGKAFEPGKRYAWQVQAFDRTMNTIGENQGKSEIRSFTIPKDSSILLKPSGSGICVTTTVDSVYGWQKDAAKPCSLREAIQAANAHAGSDSICFDLAESDPGYDAARGVWTFTFGSELTALADNGTTIDGSSQQAPAQAGSRATLWSGCRAPLIELDGTGRTCGLRIAASRCAVRGLAVFNCSAQGIFLQGSFNTLACNVIGTDAGEVKGRGNGVGVQAAAGTTGNAIGVVDGGNVISGNTRMGVYIHGNAGRSSIECNLVGVNAAADDALPNGAGIVLDSGASNIRIGTTGTTAKTENNRNRQVISGNTREGIRIEESDYDRILGNFIGVGGDGRRRIGNGGAGILLMGSHGTVIGGDSGASRNVISGNDNGILVTRKTRASAHTRIEGNYIGTNATGTDTVPNRRRGIHVSGKTYLTAIGGSSPADGNIIAGNVGAGVRIDSGAGSTTVANNIIGECADGGPCGNGQGVAMYSGARNNWIGGPPAQANVIAWNAGDGVHAEDSATMDNGIASNSIHDNGGRGIGLYKGAHGTQPGLRIWETKSLGGGKYYIVGQLDSAAYRSRVAVYSDNGGEGRACEVPLATADSVRTGWFGSSAKRTYSAFTYTVSDSMGLNTSEFLTPAAPAHVGSWLFDMDFWQYDQDNLCPENPHHHGGWWHLPPREEIRDAFRKGASNVADFASGFVDLDTLVHNVFATYRWDNFCNSGVGYEYVFFMNYAVPALFTGRMYWETFMFEMTCLAGDMDNNMGLLTPPGTGVNINTQRYFDHAKSGGNRIVHPNESDGSGVDADARNWPAPKAGFIQKTLQKHPTWRPILTLEIDRCETFDDWEEHPFWSKLTGYATNEEKLLFPYLTSVPGDDEYRSWLNDKRAIVIGVWTMDCVHECRSEVHPVYGMAIQDSCPASGSPGREVWHFFMRNKGNQAYCGQDCWIEGHPDWYFRFPGRAGSCTITASDGWCDEHDANTVTWSVARSKNDVLVSMHLPHKDDWLIGTVVIEWP